VRLWLVTGLMTVGVMYAIAAVDGRWPTPPASAALALLALAYPAAMAGVARGRRGAGVGEPAVEVTATRDRPPFASPADAQNWYEWRRLLLPVLGGCWVSLLALPAMILISLSARRPMLLQLEPFGGMVREFGPGWLAAAAGLVLPAWVALFGGMELGKLREPPGGLEMSPFQAGKPVPDGFFLAAKFRLVTWAALVNWGTAWLIVFVFCAVTGELPGMAERASHRLGSPWAAVAAVPALAALLFALSWLWTARALWAGLWTSPVAGIGPVMCGFLLPSAAVNGLWWVAALGLAAEAFAMAFLARHSPHRGKVAAIVVVCVAAAFVKAWPVVLVAWPFAGLLLAPTAVRRNRHR
ncbi:MAG: hypothetical protein ACRC33_08190, partial [Gemmataceae bacterium]